MKKLLIIGNKSLDKDYSDLISSFDFVVRINRMLNYEFSKGKTDLWLLDVWPGNTYNLYKHEFEENKHKYLNVKNIITLPHNREFGIDFIKEIGSKAVLRESVDYFEFINKYIPSCTWDLPGLDTTNSMWMLSYCLENYFKDYKIYTLGIGSRYFLNQELHSCHRRLYKAEEYFIEQLILNKQITPLDFDKEVTPFKVINKTKYTKKIPSVSSYFNEDVLELPELVVTSINSFVTNGCPYFLYSYRTYRNIPKGCILKDANEIMPYESDQYFIDYFKINLINKYNTAWTNPTNIFITDSFNTKSVIILKDGIVNTSFIYVENNNNGNKLKKLMLRFVNLYRKNLIQKSLNELFASALDVIGIKNCSYDYYECCNNFPEYEEFELWEWDEQEYMHFRNKDVNILVMDSDISTYNKNSYMAKIIKKYDSNSNLH